MDAIHILTGHLTFNLILMAQFISTLLKLSFSDFIVAFYKPQIQKQKAFLHTGIRVRNRSERLEGNTYFLPIKKHSPYVSENNLILNVTIVRKCVQIQNQELKSL